jgi:hypothetical protein
MISVGEPTDESGFSGIGNGHGMSFSGADHAEKQAGAVGEGEISAVWRKSGAHDRLVFGIAGQAAFGEPNRGGGSVTGLPTAKNSKEQDKGSCQSNLPIPAGMRGTLARLTGLIRLWALGWFLERRGGVVDGSDETVATAGESFDETGIVSGITESVPKTLDGGVEAMLEVDEGVGRPELALQLFPGDELAGFGQEKD